MNPFPVYADMLVVYRRWAPSLLLLAAIVFLPVGLLHAVAESADISTPRFDLGGLLELLGLTGAIAALAITSLLGTVFYAGAVTISLTEAKKEGAMAPLREVSSRLAYGRLIAVDLLFGVVVAIGIVLLVAPGITIYVWWALAAPVIEMEDLGVRAALRRSRELVRGRFWLVLAVLIPIELLAGAVSELATGLAHGAFEHELVAAWIADSLSNFALAPFYAISAVMLTARLIREKEGDGTPVTTRQLR